MYNREMHKLSFSPRRLFATLLIVAAVGPGAYASVIYSYAVPDAVASLSVFDLIHGEQTTTRLSGWNGYFYSAGGFEQTSLFVLSSFTSAAPKIQMSAKIIPNLPKGAANARQSADVTLNYYFSPIETDPSASPATTIGVIIPGQFTGDLTGINSESTVSVYDNATQTLIASATSSESNPFLSGAYSLSFTATLGATYRVVMSSGAGGCFTSGANEFCGNLISNAAPSYSSGIDPVVEIDPSAPNASDFSLILSQNLDPALDQTTVPEPATWHYAAAVLTCLGFVRRARLCREKLRERETSGTSGTEAHVPVGFRFVSQTSRSTRYRLQVDAAEWSDVTTYACAR
jgi:hypothetical protein